MSKYIKKEDRASHLVKYKDPKYPKYFYRRNGGKSTWLIEEDLFTLLEGPFTKFRYTISISNTDVEHLLPAEFLL